jgi:hypothetical protein
MYKEEKLGSLSCCHGGEGINFGCHEKNGFTRVKEDVSLTEFRCIECTKGLRGSAGNFGALPAQDTLFLIGKKYTLYLICAHMFTVYNTYIYVYVYIYTVYIYIYT